MAWASDIVTEDLGRCSSEEYPASVSYTWEKSFSILDEQAQVFRCVCVREVNSLIQAINCLLYTSPSPRD